MYKSLLPELKPLIFEGKSGVMHITYQNVDYARLYLNEGLIEQVETESLQGVKAVEKCLKWVSIETDFKEGDPGEYVRDEKIDTNAILSYLEKAHHNVQVIKQHISDNNAVLQIDADKLQKTNGLNKDSIKAALFFNGKATLAEVIAMTGNPERTVLIHACKLLISGCARILPSKNVLDKTERVDFLRTISSRLTDLVGPVGPMLVDDAMVVVGTDPYSLTREELPRIVEEILRHLEDDERTELTVWSSYYLEDNF